MLTVTYQCKRTVLGWSSHNKLQNLGWHNLLFPVARITHIFQNVKMQTKTAVASMLKDQRFNRLKNTPVEEIVEYSYYICYIPIYTNIHQSACCFLKI